MEDSPKTLLESRGESLARASAVTSAVAVIVPCFNEEGAIVDTVEALCRHLNQMDVELLVVDDGSTDDTPRVLSAVEGQYAPLTVVRHERNRGYGAAIKTGIRRSSAPLVVITDADGTYPMERIPELVELAQDADMVVGARTSDDVVYPFVRRIPKFFLARYAAWITGEEIPDMNSGLRVMRRDILERFFNILPNGFSFTTTITVAMLTNSYDVRFVPIGYAPRIGKSKIQPVRDTLRFFQLILRTGMYFSPLRVFFPLAVVLGIGFLGSMWYDVFVLRDLTDKTLILLLFCLNTGMFALLADMLDKRI